MGVFKEEAFTFEEVARRQRQIYSDAADYGMPYVKSNPPQPIKDLIESVKTFKVLDAEYPKEKSFIRRRQTWKGGVQIAIRIGWEIDEGMECGTQYTITYNKIGKHPSLISKDCNAFISVDIERYREPANIK